MKGRIDAEMLGLRVTGTRVDELRFPMIPPLRLAGRSVHNREYVVLQVTLETGITGTAYVLTRGQPICAATKSLAQQIIGHDLASLFAKAERISGKSADHRARAILDNCAWDLAGQLLEVPTCRLLADTGQRQPALLVAGYRRLGECDDSMARRLVDCRDSGYRWLKIAADIADAGTTRLLTAIRKLVSADDLKLVLDLGFAGHDPAQLRAAVQEWQPFDITWVEDPAPVEVASLIAKMRTGSGIPIAAGDEASSDELYGLLDHSAVDVLRADSTTVGGLTGVAEVVARSNVPISLHVYPEIHRHAAVTMAADSPVETFPRSDEFDFVDRFLHAEDATLVDGYFAPPTTPGLGVQYQPEAVSANVVHTTTFNAV